MSSSRGTSLVTKWIVRYLVGKLIFSVFGVFLLVVATLIIVQNQNNGLDWLLKICSPSGGAGPEQLQPAPKTSPRPGTAPAAYELFLDAPPGGPIPSNYFTLYQAAAKKWSIRTADGWTVLAAIGWVETQHGTLKGADGKPLQGVLSGENPWGAGGQMQFLLSTWNRVAYDADHDGQKSRYDPADAIFSAAKLLKVHIFGPGVSEERPGRPLTNAELYRSIFSYNHSDVYVNDVLRVANQYANGYTLGPPNYGGQKCVSAGPKGSALGRSIAVNAAHFTNPRRGKGVAPTPPTTQVGPVPYVWGGNTPAGFDCSGLVVYAVKEVSGGRINLPRTSQAMWNGNIGDKVPRNQLAPGDLLFFRMNGQNGVQGPAHVGVYYGVYNGRRWMVEAPRTGEDVKFSDFDAKTSYVGAIRIKAPLVGNAMAPLGARVGGVAA